MQPRPEHRARLLVPRARLVRPRLSGPLQDASGPAATLLLSAGGASSGGFEWLLIPAVALALLVLAAAVTPARALPGQVDVLLDGRRETLAFTATCVLLAFVAALLIAHSGS